MSRETNAFTLFFQTGFFFFYSIKPQILDTNQEIKPRESKQNNDEKDIGFTL